MGTNLGILKRLLDLSTALLDASTLDEAMQALTDAGSDLLPGDHVSLRVFDESRTMLLCGARSGTAADHRPMEFCEGEGIVGWVARQGWPAFVDEAAADARFKAGSDQGFVVGSILAVPLLVDGQVVGVLGATAPQTHAFAAEHEVLLSLLANVAAPVIGKKRLERLAIVDAETMAFAKSYFPIRLEEEIGRARRHDLHLSVLRLSVEHLPPRGDAIRFLADTVRCVLRRSDVLFRTGQSELSVILPHTGERPAEAVADRLRGTLEVTLLGETLGLWPADIATVAWDGEEDAASLFRRCCRS